MYFIVKGDPGCKKFENPWFIHIVHAKVMNC